MKTEWYEYSNAEVRGAVTIKALEGDADGKEIDGYVLTPEGIVLVSGIDFVNLNEDHIIRVTYRMIIRSRVYWMTRTGAGAFPTKRGAATIAGRFAYEAARRERIGTK